MRGIRRSPPPFLEALPPASRLPAIPFAFLEPPSGPRLRGSPSSVLGRAALPVIQGLSPRTVGRPEHTACQLLQSLRFLSTTVDLTITLRAWLGVTPRRRSYAGGVASFDALPVELSLVQGPAFALQRRRRLPTPKRGSFAPTMISPDTSCYEPVFTPAGEAGATGTMSPRARRRTAQGHPRQGCIVQPSAKRVGLCAPEVPSIKGQPRRAGSLTPQVVTNLWSNQLAAPFLST